MNITRNNYEELFMLYADDELTAAQRKAVEAFIAANPDLRAEMELFQQFKLSPDAELVFSGKEMLMRPEAGMNINADNYESFFVLYADEELTEQEKAGVNDFVNSNVQYSAAFELAQQVKLIADTSIVFKNKEALYRKEKDDRVIPLAWWRLIAAAAVLLLVGIYWLNQSGKGDKMDVIVKMNQPVTIPQQPTLEQKGTSIATNSNKQPVVEAITAEVAKKQDRQAKYIAPANTIIAVVKSGEKENNQVSDNPREMQIVSGAIDVADNATDNLKGVSVASVNEKDEHVEINTGKTAAASKSVKDQQLVYVDAGERNNVQAEYAVATNGNENLEILNTSVNTKNSLRGFLRKASRVIAKKTNSGSGDSSEKSILIGGFEIAVR